MDRRIDLLLQLVDQAFDKRAWHGTNLRGAVRGLSAEEAAWRPAPGRHSIWEIVLHAAYWKFCVRRHLTGDRSLRFGRKGSDWPVAPTPLSELHWKRDVGLLRAEHRSLRAAIEALPAARLVACPPGLKWRYEQYIYGAASHDLYHAGQIQLIKRLRRTGRPLPS
jgi:hypothetical protein